MKKILLILLLATVLLTGCKNKPLDKEDLEKENEIKLEAKLKEFANNIFDDKWTKGGIKTGIYTVTLKDINENMKYDTSMFKNTKGKSCNDEKTKIEFIVETQIIPDKTNYEIKYTLSCE